MHKHIYIVRACMYVCVSVHASTNELLHARLGQDALVQHMIDAIFDALLGVLGCDLENGVLACR